MKTMDSGPKRSHKEAKGSHIHDAEDKKSCSYSGFIYSANSIVFSEWQFAVSPIHRVALIHRLNEPGWGIPCSQRWPVLSFLLKIQRCIYFLHSSHSLVGRHFTAKQKKKTPDKKIYPALTLRERFLEVTRLLGIYKYLKSMFPLNHWIQNIIKEKATIHQAMP
jgi:hypothetical protein